MRKAKPSRHKYSFISQDQIAYVGFCDLHSLIPLLLNWCNQCDAVTAATITDQSNGYQEAISTDLTRPGTWIVSKLSIYCRDNNCLQVGKIVPRWTPKGQHFHSFSHFLLLQRYFRNRWGNWGKKRLCSATSVVRNTALQWENWKDRNEITGSICYQNHLEIFHRQLRRVECRSCVVRLELEEWRSKLHDMKLLQFELER